MKIRKIVVIALTLLAPISMQAQKKKPVVKKPSRGAFLDTDSSISIK